MPKKIRLGQRMEYFMEAALKSHPNYRILAKNLQIIPDKVTVGELDFLFYDLPHKKHVHLEMAYKFYLYDDTVSENWQKCWIGTDRGDSLYVKIQKLKSKQLPLLFKKETRPYLEELKVQPKNIGQRISLKGQLFLPLHKNITMNPVLNQKAIAGHWIRPSDLSAWNKDTFSFFLPKKRNWVEVLRNETVKWVSYELCMEQMVRYLAKNYAAMLWIKSQNGSLERIMVVKWDE